MFIVQATECVLKKHSLKCCYISSENDELWISLELIKKILEIIDSSQKSSVNTNLIKSYVKIIRTIFLQILTL
jgi:hypothetical protein